LIYLQKTAQRYTILGKKYAWNENKSLLLHEITKKKKKESKKWKVRGLKNQSSWPKALATAS
jgi:hypothetical protein